MTTQRYEENEYVWLWDFQKKNGLSKLRKKFKGPFRIVNKLSVVLYEIEQCYGPYKGVVHYKRLKPYVGNTENLTPGATRWQKMMMGILILF